MSFPSVLEVVWHERELLSDMVELAYTSPVAEPVAASRTSVCCSAPDFQTNVNSNMLSVENVRKHGETALHILNIIKLNILSPELL